MMVAGSGRSFRARPVEQASTSDAALRRASALVWQQAAQLTCGTPCAMQIPSCCDVVADTSPSEWFDFAPLLTLVA